MVTKTCCHLIIIILNIIIITVVVVVVAAAAAVVAVIATASYLTDKGEHNALYKTHNNVYIKASKIMIMYS